MMLISFWIYAAILSPGNVAVSASQCDRTVRRTVSPRLHLCTQLVYTTWLIATHKISKCDGTWILLADLSFAGSDFSSKDDSVHSHLCTLLISTDCLPLPLLLHTSLLWFRYSIWKEPSIRMITYFAPRYELDSVLTNASTCIPNFFSGLFF